ncbi:MAG TPA: prepilin-type N-terminal cleavage/methylation domain-containing protein [Planctomycetota bacterium]|nr:prepilin-type N-terminal cleavage/methylation domain-containing protein [Planctomycetota bacterium]
MSERESVRARRAGFTIVEVVMAMALLLLGMTSILGLLSFGVALSRTAALRTSAASAVEAVVADLEEHLFPLVTDPQTGDQVAGEPSDVLERPLPGQAGILYSARVTADPSPDRTGADRGPRVYRVDVVMSWSSGGSRRTKSFTTLLLQEVPFGARMRRLFVAPPEAAAQAAPPQRKP